MGRRNIYIRDEDEGVWDTASELVGKEESMSQVIVRGLKNYIRSRQGEPMELLTVVLRDRSDQESIKKFSGRWLIQEFTSSTYAIVSHPVSLSTDEFEADDTDWYVAETAKGQLAVWAASTSLLSDGSGFFVFKDLDDAETHGVPADVISAASHKLGIDRAELLDI